MSINLLLWALFAGFAGTAIGYGWHDGIFGLRAPLAGVKVALWLAWVAFVAYSAYCSRHESLAGTVRTMTRFHWGRQMGIDLYLGLALWLLVIGLHSGSAAVLLLWLLPVLLFGNLATLLYAAIHFDSIVARLSF